MAYAAVSKTVEGNLVWVRLPPPAPVFVPKLSFEDFAWPEAKSVARHS